MSLNAISSKKVKHLIRDRALIHVPPECSVADASRLMQEKNIGALAVLDDGKLVGIISERDVVQRCVGMGLDCVSTPVRLIMSFPPITIDRNLSMGVAVVMMMEANIRHLPVMNGNRVLGMISIRQLVAEFRAGIERSFLKIAA